MRRLIDQVLQAHGFSVLLAEDGDVALDLLRSGRPEAVVLDLKMPRVSGLEMLRQLRAAGEDVPVIVLTGVADEEWILAAFAAGADDYVTKPFQHRVLVARLQAVLRRHQPVDGTSAPREQVGDVTLNPHTLQARVGERTVTLTPTEYRLLRLLMHGAGRVFSVSDLLARVWGPAYVGQDDIVRANVYRLRQKLEPQPARPRYILGRRGAGYAFVDAPMDAL